MFGWIPRRSLFRMLLSPAVFFFWLYSLNSFCLVRASDSDVVEWVPSTPKNAPSLKDRAVAAGIEDNDGSPLWVIRARLQGDLLPGKLAVSHNAAYVSWGGEEYAVEEFEVCCADVQSKLAWVEAKDGNIPGKAIVAGHTKDESLYAGRVWHNGTLVPGKVQPSHKCMYISYGGKEYKYATYEVLCKA